MHIPTHLPERLTISFPIWLLYGTDPDSPYYDLDRLMREHRERGFNCMRFDDGVGLLWDREGAPRPPFRLRRCFGRFDPYLRQMQTREGIAQGLADRLFRICEAAKRHGMTLILSSWYYLHTFWMVDCDALNRQLFGVESLSVFPTFGEFLDKILSELEERGLDDCIAFAEILNEADGLDICGGYGKRVLSREEAAALRHSHEEAVRLLRERHPRMLFAYDSFTPRSNVSLIPRNLQVYNFHSYFLWGIFGEFRKAVGELALLPQPERHTIEEIRLTRSGQPPGLLSLRQNAILHPATEGRAEECRAMRTGPRCTERNFGC